MRIGQLVQSQPSKNGKCHYYAQTCQHIMNITSVPIKSTATVHKIQGKCTSLTELQRSTVVFEKL